MLYSGIVAAIKMFSDANKKWLPTLKRVWKP